MLKINIKVTGLESFPGQPEIRAAIHESLRRAGQLVKVTAERNVGRFMRVRTGKLRRSFVMSVRERGQSFVVTVKNTAFYAHILEGGAAPHKIPGGLTRREQREGSRQKVLRFQAGGKTVFATAVNHPGLRGRHWFAGSVREAIPDLQKIFEQEITAAIAKPGAAA